MQRVKTGFIPHELRRNGYADIPCLFLLSQMLPDPNGSSAYARGIVAAMVDPTRVKPPLLKALQRDVRTNSQEEALSKSESTPTAT